MYMHMDMYIVHVHCMYTSNIDGAFPPYLTLLLLVALGSFWMQFRMFLFVDFVSLGQSQLRECTHVYG